MRQYFNWKTYLILFALLLVAASLVYTNQLAGKLATEEKKKVSQLVLGIKTLNEASATQDFGFIVTFLDSNTTIPLIITDEHRIPKDSKNIDSAGVKDMNSVLRKKMKEYEAVHAPILIDYGIGKSYIFYGESYLLTQLKYFPYVQLVIVALFIVVILIALSSAHRSIQNQVWVGLSKETAHQLGTPLSAIEGWLELLKYEHVEHEAVVEMQKDLDRLKLVADRFSKVGSAPQMEEESLLPRLENMVSYMQKRAPHKVKISLHAPYDHIPVYISGPLFDWVVENLMRNALDAMAGEGSITVNVTDHPHHVWIDIEDTGKGIPKHQVKKVFNPGFTTKKRGWGLGLSLSKRIIEKYHHGSLVVKHSEVGKGTTFRIILRR